MICLKYPQDEVSVVLEFSRIDQMLYALADPWVGSIFDMRGHVDPLLLQLFPHVKFCE